MHDKTKKYNCVRIGQIYIQTFCCFSYIKAGAKRGPSSALSIFSGLFLAALGRVIKG